LVDWQALDKVQQSLNEALRKLKTDEDAEDKLHKIVADGRDRLGRLHRELGESSLAKARCENCLEIGDARRRRRGSGGLGGRWRWRGSGGLGGRWWSLTGVVREVGWGER
jgi:hypothetical protein